MAKIILEPNEVFEHYHTEASTTTLLSGKARYQMEDVELALELNVPVLTPPSKSHILTNTGVLECVIGCGH